MMNNAISTDALFGMTADRAKHYLDDIRHRHIAPTTEALTALEQFNHPLPEGSTNPNETISRLDEIGSPATIASTQGRYYGFVVGGALPVTVAASWLSAVWDQNAYGQATSPVNARLESVVQEWVLDLLDLPREAVVGFVSGATMANFSALMAARHHLLKRAGWDVEADGLFGAPPITVVVGEEVHASMLKALSLAGFGRNRVKQVPVDNQGRMIAEQMPPLDEMTLICIQAGNVNSGAFDPAQAIGAKVRDAGAWLHVDGAFGLWARVSPELSEYTIGLELADSWGVDAHKWLNVPYDSGLVICRYPAALSEAMIARGSYLVEVEGREPYAYVPELSRKARVIEIWAALHSLGRSGVRDLIERSCELAGYFAEGLGKMGFEVLNDVVINQIVVTFGEKTPEIIQALHEDGTMWAGPTTWHGRHAMRISISNWQTTLEDVDISLKAIERIASISYQGVDS